MESIQATLLLLLASAGTGATQFLNGFKEEDFFCKQDNVFLPSAKVCDGVVDCGGSSGVNDGDENTLICAPAPYLHNGASLEATDVTGTSVHLSWDEPPRHISGHSLKLAGYLLSGKSDSRTTRQELPKHWHAHTVKGLNPLTPYTFTVRPYYTKSGRSNDREEHRSIGKAAVVDVKTLSKDYSDLSITPVSSSEVLISWTPLEPVPMFQVTMLKEQGQGKVTVHEVRAFNGSENTVSTHSILFRNLEPWTHYVAQLEACSEEKCTDAGKRGFRTPPGEFPRPVVTEIQSTHAGSISLKWSFPGVDHELYSGFRVRFCERNASTCLLVFSKGTELEAEGLAEDTTYHVDVRAHLKLADGILKLGPPGTATVTTWTDVPVLAVSHELDFYDQSGTSLLTWTTVNSSVTYFQYRIDESHPWTSCNESAACNVTASRKSTERHETGYMSIRHDKTYGNVTIRVRGCNDHGCGKESSVAFVWNGLDYIAASEFRVFYYDGKAKIRWDQYTNDGIEIAGQCGTDWKVHYENRIYPYTRVHSGEEVTAQGLPTDVADCEFIAKTYKETRGLTYYSIPKEAYKV